MGSGGGGCGGGGAGGGGRCVSDCGGDAGHTGMDGCYCHLWWRVVEGAMVVVGDGSV